VLECTTNCERFDMAAPACEVRFLQVSQEVVGFNGQTWQSAKESSDRVEVRFGFRVLRKGTREIFEGGNIVV
jgi:hypothetical protein